MAITDSQSIKWRNNKAAKEIVANIGNSVGTSFTMTQSTGVQLASDLSKGAIQGLSAYM